MKTEDWIAGLCAATIVSLVGGFALGAWGMNESWKVDSVRHGVGEYRTNARFEPEWHWK